MIKSISETKSLGYQFLCMVILGLSVFCLLLALVRSRQYIMRYGYSIGNLECACSHYEQKISELDRKIISMSARSKIMEQVETGAWKSESVVVHISNGDVQRYALASGKYADVAAVGNFLEQTKITR
jgi:hypothetical protein